IYVCTTAGTSGGSTPAWAVGGVTVADGTVVWTHQDHAVVNMTAHGIFIGNLLAWGQVKGPTNNKQITFINNTFTRTDWLSNVGDPYDLSLTAASFVKAWNNRVVYTGILNGASQQYSSPGHPANVDAILGYCPMW